MNAMRVISLILWLRISNANAFVAFPPLTRNEIAVSVSSKQSSQQLPRAHDLDTKRIQTHLRESQLEEPTPRSKPTNHDKIKINSFDPSNILNSANQKQQEEEKSNQNRRLFFSSVLLSSSLALSTSNPQPSLADEITWSASPVNKRSGISLFKAEETFNIRFITYLSRFLLSFDEECQKWWYKRAGDIPRTATSEQVDAMRLKQFGQFSASVEVGLQEYDNKDGPSLLLSSLLDRYGKDIDEIKKIRVEQGLPPFKPSEEEREKREIREAKRQIALLFGLLQTYQPVEDITKLLASIDNGYVDTVKIINPGAGYAPGYGSPRVVFPPPVSGIEENTATGRAKLTPSGKILRVDITKRGGGYSKPPTVAITPPLSDAFGSPFAQTATAKAFIYRDGANKGKVERIELTSPGAGYAEGEPIEIQLSPPDATEGGHPCTAKAILEYEVGSIQITNPGKGYATEKPLDVQVEPPPLTARVNLNDPLVAQTLDLDKFGNVKSSEVFNSKAWKLAKSGGGGGCVGRACYDEPVVAIAYPIAESDSYKSFRESNFFGKNRDSSDVKINAAGDENDMKPMPFWKGGKSSSAQLLSLLPAGIGLIYKADLKRYELVAGETVMDFDYADAVSPGKPLDPDFGPRGRSPIEREKKLDSGTLLRFYLSGALCASSIHLALTPIDVVKTNIQADPKKYTGPLKAFNVVLEEEGASGFFAGWIPTFIGFFIQGGVSFTAIEFFRRYYTELIGDIAVNYELPIILAASVSPTIHLSRAFETERSDVI